PDECVTVVDNGANDANPTGGQFLLTGLALGRHTLRETVPPSTFRIDTFIEIIELTLASPNMTATHVFVDLGGEGCTPGYWKNHPEARDQTSDPTIAHMPSGLRFTTATRFNTYFNLTSAQSGFSNTFTMLDAVNAGGGNAAKMARHGVSALLNMNALINYQLPAGLP